MMTFEGQFNRDFKKYLNATEFGQSLSTIHIEPILVFRWMPLEIQFAWMVDFLKQVKKIKVYLDIRFNEELEERWNVMLIHPVYGYLVVGMNFNKKTDAIKTAVRYCNKQYNLEEISPPY